MQPPGIIHALPVPVISFKLKLGISYRNEVVRCGSFSGVTRHWQNELRRCLQDPSLIVNDIQKGSLIAICQTEVTFFPHDLQKLVDYSYRLPISIPGSKSDIVMLEGISAENSWIKLDQLKLQLQSVEHLSRQPVEPWLPQPQVAYTREALETSLIQLGEIGKKMLADLKHKGDWEKDWDLIAYGERVPHE